MPDIRAEVESYEQRGSTDHVRFVRSDLVPGLLEGPVLSHIQRHIEGVHSTWTRLDQIKDLHVPQEASQVKFIINCFENSTIV